MKWLLRILLLLVALAAAVNLRFNHSDTSMDHLSTLARAGSIHDSSPVKATVEITADAPPAVVWGVLTNINAWPAWQPNIGKAHAPTPLAPGSNFKWNMGGNAIRSRIELLEPNHRIAWVGTAFDARAVHVWTLEPLPGNQTLIRTAESMDGIGLSLFFSSKDLADSDQQWLSALKSAAEKQQAAEPLR